MADVLSQGELRRLTEHKYSVSGTSILEPGMQHFWRWLVEQVPMWWAPNAITLTGLIINIVSTFVLMVYSPDGKQEPPGWSLLLPALGLFIYQSLDAIDGKQARRTKSSSPLGELFDHGCDALSIVFVMVGTCIALKIGEEPGWFIFECFSSMFLFYLAHWQTYCSGTLKFGIIDVTEAQFMVMIIYVFSALLGSSVWSTQVPWLQVPLRRVVVWSSLVTAFVALKTNFYDIFVKGGVGRHGATIADTSVLAPIMPIGMLLMGGYYVAENSPSNVFYHHPILFVISFGMASAKVTNRLVVAHMSRSEMILFDSSLLGPLMLFLNQYFNIVLNEYLALWMCLFYCTADLLRYSINVCFAICDHMDIYCFSISPPPAKSLSNNGVDSARPLTRSRAAPAKK